MKNNSKYIAIKVNGLAPWLWFERSKITREDGKFTGEGGWGDDGARTEIVVDEYHIEGEIASETLQFE